jgi:hypothetical protein
MHIVEMRIILRLLLAYYSLMLRPISRSYHTRNEWTHMYRDVSKCIEAYAFTLVEMPTFLYVHSTQTD